MRQLDLLFRVAERLDGFPRHIALHPCGIVLASHDLVERVPLEAPDGEPLRLEFESFVAAVRGEQPVAVSGEDGREALDVALRIVREIERTLPALRGRPVAAAPLA